MPGHQALMYKFQRENRANPTPSELRIMNLLQEMGERFVFEKGFYTYNSFYLVDFYLPKPRKVCLEIDGPIHENRLSYDFQRDTWLMRVRRIRAIIRIKNEDAMKITKEELNELINY